MDAADRRGTRATNSAHRAPEHHLASTGLQHAESCELLCAERQRRESGAIPARRQHLWRRPKPNPDVLPGSRIRLQAVADHQRAIWSTGIPVLVQMELLTVRWWPSQLP